MVHVNGSWRVQTVTEAGAPALAACLRAFEAETDVGVLLNTSLNGPDQPIVGGATDALAFFISHTIDALMIEDVLIERR